MSDPLVKISKTLEGDNEYKKTFNNPRRKSYDLTVTANWYQNTISLNCTPREDHGEKKAVFGCPIQLGDPEETPNPHNEYTKIFRYDQNNDCKISNKQLSGNDKGTYVEVTANQNQTNPRLRYTQKMPKSAFNFYNTIISQCDSKKAKDNKKDNVKPNNSKKNNSLKASVK